MFMYNSYLGGWGLLDFSFIYSSFSFFPFFYLNQMFIIMGLKKVASVWDKGKEPLVVRSFCITVLFLEGDLSLSCYAFGNPSAKKRYKNYLLCPSSILECTVDKKERKKGHL